jgi:hypothetical protein
MCREVKNKRPPTEWRQLSSRVSKPNWKHTQIYLYLYTGTYVCVCVCVCTYVCRKVCMYVCMYACRYVCVHTQYAHTPASALLQLNVVIQSSNSGSSRLKSQVGNQTTEVLFYLPQSLRQSSENYFKLGHGQFVSNNYLLMVLMFSDV